MIIITKTVHVSIPDNELLSLHDVVRNAATFMAALGNRSQSVSFLYFQSHFNLTLFCAATSTARYLQTRLSTSKFKIKSMGST